MAKQKSTFDPDHAFKSIVAGKDGADIEEILAAAGEEPEQQAKARRGAIGIAKLEAPKAEVGSQRVNIVLKPSMYKRAKEKCGSLGISFNECVNQFIEIWLAEE
ncbi:MAG: hypothetical protein FWG10_01010 [Eubacteriaceae bacterium]|nr:hypothetical protein [Eubacteriaceae bacterium]